MQPKDRLMVALDVSSVDDASRLIEVLSPWVGYFKIGLEFITKVGAPAAVQLVKAGGGRVFFDGKFCDIPNTVGHASRAVSSLEVDFFNVHASCGEASIKAAIENRGSAKLLVVTVLTSLSDQSSQSLFGAPALPKVVAFSKIAAALGAQGVVCSPQELSELAKYPELKTLLRVTPGVRPTWAMPGDQKRVMTPKEAIHAGANYLVVGRPITDPPKEIGSPVEAAKRIVAEIEEATS